MDVQASPLSGRDHPGLCSLVLQVWDLVPESDGDDAGARSGSGPDDDHRYALELEKRVRTYQGYGSTSWRVDETYVKVGGKWKYLFRAVDKHGGLIDFMLSDRRNSRAAQRFLAKALTIMRDWPRLSITTDKLRSYPVAIESLKRKELLPMSTRHRTSKYLNNIIEADHGALKRIVGSSRSVRSSPSTADR